MQTLAWPVDGPEFRNLTEGDLESMIDVMAKSRADDPYERRLTMDEAMEYSFLDPDFDPAGSWLVTLDGETVGFGSCLVESNRIAAGKDDAYIEIDVVPPHKNRGIEQLLLDRELAYIRSRGVGSALCRCIASDEDMHRLLTSNSFEEAYRVFILARRSTERVTRPQTPEGCVLRRMDMVRCSDGDIEDLVCALNDSFQDHFNFAPERGERFINFRDCSADPHMITLALKDGKTAGFCLSGESRTLNQERGAKTGWVDILGVRPSFRRMGLGKALLADGVDWLLDRGMDTVYLGVFAKNEKALDLYRSFGFSKDRESIWLRKALA